MEHREPLEAEPAPIDSRWIVRFRRLPRRRLIALGSVGIIAVLLAPFAWTWIVGKLWGFVARHPEQQLAFAEITLVPEPPPWIRLGRSGFLERVRIEARHGETLPLLLLDLESLRNDFKRNPWVSQVAQVRRDYGKLIVHLTYRKPVAEFPLERVILDKDGVVLPIDELDLVDNYRDGLIRGIDHPLIKLLGFPVIGKTTAGLIVKKADDLPDLEILGAAHLADFLTGQSQTSSLDNQGPRLLTISPYQTDQLQYFVRDFDNNLIFWQHAPGAEAPGEHPAARKWAMLADQYQRGGPLKTKGLECVMFDRSTLKVVKLNLNMSPRSKSSN